MSNEEINEAEVAKRIRSSYIPAGESDLEKLRNLDKKVKRPAEITAYTVGIIGALVLGTGMCIAMGVIGTEGMFPLGIVIGVVGIAIVVANYFLYKAILKRRKNKYAGEIIALSDRMLNK